MNTLSILGINPKHNLTPRYRFKISKIWHADCWVPVLCFHEVIFLGSFGNDALTSIALSLFDRVATLETAIKYKESEPKCKKTMPFNHKWATINRTRTVMWKCKQCVSQLVTVTHHKYKKNSGHSLLDPALKSAQKRICLNFLPWPMLLKTR